MEMLTEQKVMKKLGVMSFKDLTKPKVIELAGMLDKMDTEVAKKALEQFPDFAKTTKEILVEYKDTLDKGMVSNQESVSRYYDICSTIIHSLEIQLQKEDLTFEERKYIIEKMVEIEDRVNKKDSENKRFIITQWLIGLTAVSGLIGFLATVLGAKTHIEGNDTDETPDKDDESDNKAA